MRLYSEKIEIKNNSATITFESMRNVDSILQTQHQKHQDCNIVLHLSDIESDIVFDNLSEVPIKLKENKDYLIRIETTTSILQEDLDDINKNIFSKLKKRDRNIFEGYFNSKNHIGILNLELFNFEDKIVEVMSEKFDHESDYEAMIIDINECFFELISSSKSSFESARDFSDNRCDSNMYYFKYCYIKNILGKHQMQSWLSYIFKNHHSQLMKDEEEKNIFECDELEIENLIQALNSDNLIEHGERRIPLKVQYNNYIETKDTDSNRFVKFFLEYLKNDLEFVEKRLETNLRKECKTLILKLEEMLSHHFFKGIKSLNNVPYNSQILQKKYPYKEIFRVYNNLQLSSKIVSNLNYEVGQKDIPTLYEYWSFIKITNILKSSLNLTEVDFSEWIKLEEKTLNVNLIRGIKTKYILENDIELNVYYNKPYTSIEMTEDGGSYSQEFRPDISMELYRGDFLFGIIHFDAKYKSPENKSFVPEDLDKMHTYRDGILSTCGSFILCLGIINKTFYKPSVVENLEGFPSVGAFSFIPGRGANRELVDVIKSFIQLVNKGGEAREV